MKQLISLFVVLFLFISVNLYAQRETVSVGYVHQVLDMNETQFHGHNACGPTSAVMLVKHHNLQPNSPNSYPGYYVYNSYPDFTDKSGEDYNSESAMDWNPDLSPEHVNLVYGAHGYIVIPDGDDWPASLDFLRGYLENHGLTLKNTVYSNFFQTVKDNIDAGLPLIGYINTSYGGHYLVIVGYDETENKIVVNDPYGDYNYPSSWANGDTRAIEVDYNISLFRRLIPINPIGIYENYNGWHDNTYDQQSLSIVNQYVGLKNSSPSHDLGSSYDNGGDVYVHEWYGVWLQDFKCLDANNDGNPDNGFVFFNTAIILNSNGEEAHLLKEGFWDVYMNLNVSGKNGPQLLGSPASGEYQVGSGYWRQDFQKGYMYYEDGSVVGGNDKVKVYEYQSGTYVLVYTKIYTGDAFYAAGVGGSTPGDPLVSLLAASPSPTYAGQNWQVQFELTAQDDPVVNDTIKVYRSEPNFVNATMMQEWTDVNISANNSQIFSTQS